MKSVARGRLCKLGLHRMTAANTYLHPGKGPECRMCKREYMREYMRERRMAARRAASKRRTSRKS